MARIPPTLRAVDPARLNFRCGKYHRRHNLIVVASADPPKLEFFGVDFLNRTLFASFAFAEFPLHLLQRQSRELRIVYHFFSCGLRWAYGFRPLFL